MADQSMASKPDVLTGSLTFTSMKPCDLSNCTKSEIKAYFENSYNLNESIFTGLKSERAFHQCPDRLRLPLIFYYGHTAAVYMNKLVLADLLKPSQRIRFEYEMLFETGVDEMSWDDLENYRMGGKFLWPRVADVAEYRRRVRELILQLIDDTPLHLPVTPENPWWAVFMGMEHERIHLETSSVLMRQLPIDMVERPPGWIYGPPTAEKSVETNPMIAVAPTTVTMGKPMDFPSYGWDNEYGSVECAVPAFEVTKYPVTNGEFLKFVEAGGYETRDLWTEEGWQWVQYRQARHPTFWVCNQGCKAGCGAGLSSYSHCQPAVTAATGDDDRASGKYRLRCVYDVIDMPYDWPAEVNYHEAKAFATWKGPDYRLPIEAECHAIRGYQAAPHTGVKSDIIFQDNVQANLNMKFGSSTPVNLFAENELGFCDVSGNVWEWCEDHFNGLPGFQTFYYYDDFSSPCFDGRHNIIMGGSWMSTGDEASRFARFAFRRHFFQHLGFRLARSLPAAGDTKIPLPVRFVADSVYIMGCGFPENPTVLDTDKYDHVAVETTNLHYKLDNDSLVIGEILSEFITNRPIGDKLLSVCSNLSQSNGEGGGGPSSVIHIGCAGGRVTFELTRFFTHVVGVDTSARLFDACTRLQKERLMTAVDTCDGSTARIDACIAPTLDTSRVVFKQLTWLPNEVGQHDLVLVTHLHRVQNVRAWTGRFREIVKPNGWLVLLLKEHWLVENVSNIICNEFVADKSEDWPYVDNGVPKTQYLSVWRRKPADSGTALV